MIIEKNKESNNPTPKGWHIHARFLIRQDLEKDG
jgi:hypothetical protein